MKRRSLIGLVIGSIFFMYSCKTDIPEPVQLAARELPDEVDFNLHVKPILSDKCYFCHGPDLANLKAGLRLDTEEGAYAVLTGSNRRAVVPGKVGKSELAHRVLTDDPDFVMPPPESSLSLTDYEKATLLKWIKQGAPYEKHWAFIPPQLPEVPTVRETEKINNEIDAFVLRQLERNGMSLQDEASKETLLRRVSFDLTGLPPTVEELDLFLNDPSPDAYEKAVDRLLASAHYGEKMATDWMDVSRFADTHGYSVDRYRPMWPWRNWVIDAFNSNMSYKQFVTWQLAGDLLPNPTKEQRLATAFNRNHAQNMEGGIVNEEFRVEYVADRANTLGKAMLAMTFECARCHDHKYDPVSQKEYFQVFSFFNQVDEAGQISWDNAMPVPTMLLTTEKQDSSISFLKKLIQQKESELTAIPVHTGEGKSLFAAEQIEAFLNKDLQAYLDFDQMKGTQFLNVAKPKRNVRLSEAQSWKKKELIPEQVPGKSGQAFLSNGDDPLVLENVGIFSRAQPFSIALWVKVPEKLETGVIFHKGQGAILYSFRGYHLGLKDNKLELMMAHTWPYNNIIEYSTQDIPKEEWVHLAMTYDGSSKADGLRLYINGKEAATEVEKDNLYKDILFPALDEEPSLKLGARWRGTGVKGMAMDELRVYERTLPEAELAALAGAELPQDEPQARTLALVHTEPNYQQRQEELTELRYQLNALIDSIPEIMVMDELQEKRPTYLLERGAYDAHGEEVTEGTPESILPFPDSLPRNRLGLAKWLFMPENPLTARVIVNRYWQSYFGNGLVKSSADFGNQGDLPTHPELLDWLAVRFQESGWDIKAMQKRIVMSATYRQSAVASEALREQDYDNSLLSRGPSGRLSAEMLRDNALAASGLLVRKTGGESVKPYQPEGLWKFNNAIYETDKGEKLYRRSLYTFWKRTVPPPSMNTFDAPSRSYCVVKRQKTSTPLQSLVLLNDPQFIEAARVLAARSLKTEEILDKRLEYIYRALTSKRPNKDVMQLLTVFYEKQKENFQSDLQKQEGWLEIGDSPLLADIDNAEWAATTLVASMVMNSEDATVKR